MKVQLNENIEIYIYDITMLCLILYVKLPMLYDNMVNAQYLASK